MKIVFDTNVLFSAFVSHGACAGLYEECLLIEQIVVSPEILFELREKLLFKAKLSKKEADEVLTAVESDAVLISPEPLNTAVCRDPDGDMVLATALSAKADAIGSTLRRRLNIRVGSELVGWGNFFKHS